MNEIDRVELELRQLRGVVSVGFNRTPAEQLIRVIVNQPESLEEVEERAARIASSHLEGKCRVVTELISPVSSYLRVTKRIRLDDLLIKTNSSSATIEVRASLRERQVISRSTVLLDKSGIHRGIATGVLKAVSGIVHPSPNLSVNFSLISKRKASLFAFVSVKYLNGTKTLDLVGMADAEPNEHLAVARATLDALNRVVLWSPS